MDNYSFYPITDYRKERVTLKYYLEIIDFLFKLYYNICVRNIMYLKIGKNILQKERQTNYDLSRN